MENNVEIIDDMLDGVEKMIGNQNEETFEPVKDEVSAPVQNSTEPIVNSNFGIKESGNAEYSAKPSISSNLDSVFDSLSSDIAGANNFMATLMEKQKKVELNETYLADKQEKLEKAEIEFEKYKKEQNDLIKLSKDKLDEYEKNQKVRLQNEEAQFNQEVEATKADMALREQTIRNESEKLNSEKTQFMKNKEAHEEVLNTANAKLESEKIQFEKYKEVEENKIRISKEEVDKYKEQCTKENEATLNLIKSKNDELEEQKLQFEKYKEVEKKKLELESKNLSQSCARFKELVSQFNMGFQQFPGDNK